MFHSKSQKKQFLNNSTFKCIFMFKVLRVTQNWVLLWHSNLLLPPNPKWSQLEAFSVASLVSTLFVVPVCSKLVHWDPKVMFHFTQNFIHSWTNWFQLPKTIKSSLKFAKSKMYLRFLLRIYGDLIKTYNVKYLYLSNKSANTTYTEEIIQSVSFYGSLEKIFWKFMRAT